MSKIEQIYTQANHLSALDKLRLVELLLNNLDQLDPEIQEAWKIESEKRWAAYKAGNTTTRSYAEVMEKYRS